MTLLPSTIGLGTYSWILGCGVSSSPSLWAENSALLISRQSWSAVISSSSGGFPRMRPCSLARSSARRLSAFSLIGVVLDPQHPDHSSDPTPQIRRGGDHRRE